VNGAGNHVHCLLRIKGSQSINRVVNDLKSISAQGRIFMQKIFVIIFFSFLIFIACKKDDQSVKQKSKIKISVASVNYPLHYFTQRIGGNQIQAVFPIPAEGDPAYWQPNEEGLSVFQSADIILLNGAGYASWLDKVSLPISKMIDTSEKLKQNYITLKDKVTHSHGLEGAHVHKGYAFTTWLNLKFAIEQATVVKKKLVQILPLQKDYFEINFQELKTDLTILDQDLEAITKDLHNTILFASHPVYQYLASGYGLTIRSEHWEPDQMITEEQWKIFKDKLKQKPNIIMLWEGQPLPQIEHILSSLGVKVVVFNPCGNIPESGDFISVMKKNIGNLKHAL
jgi:zinc transport system substrate-binding protein